MHITDDAIALPCVCTSLRKTTRAISRVYDGQMAAAGLTVSQFALLRQICAMNAAALSRLAEAMVMDRTSLYRSLTPLIRSGWVIVAEGPTGRTKLASLSPSGRMLLGEAECAWASAQRRVVDAFGAQQWTALHAGLQRLIGIAMATT